MLDSDLAKLYQCVNGTKTINLAVKRHSDRFPNDFYFQLSDEEAKGILKFQFETLNKKVTHQGKHIKYLPYAFTEQGVAMLATILRIPIASEVSINIMRAFVAMRKYISTSLIEQKYVNEIVFKHEERIFLISQKTQTDDKINIHALKLESSIYKIKIINGDD